MNYSPNTIKSHPDRPDEAQAGQCIEDRTKNSSQGANNPNRLEGQTSAGCEQKDWMTLTGGTEKPLQKQRVSFVFFLPKLEIKVSNCPDVWFDGFWPQVDPTSSLLVERTFLPPDRNLLGKNPCELNHQIGKIKS